MGGFARPLPVDAMLNIRPVGQMALLVGCINSNPSRRGYAGMSRDSR